MKYIYIYFLLLSFSITSCVEYLDVVPENDIRNIESIFTKRKDATKFFIGCYDFYLNTGSVRVDPAIAGCDEITTGDYLRNITFSKYLYVEGFKIAEGLQNPSNPILSLWDRERNFYTAIRQCNTFISNIDKVYNMTNEEKNKYKASAKAIKALYYFELLRMYGPICLVPENISVEADVEEMQLVRSPIDTCINRIVRLFDEALPHMESFIEQNKEDYGFLTKEAVYGYKAKALLFAASPLFNGNTWYSDFKNRNGEQLFNTEFDIKKWERAAIAADEAVKYCEGNGNMLDNDFTLESSEKLNTIRNIQKSVIPVAYNSTELLHGTYSLMDLDFRYRLPRYSSKQINFNNSVLGCMNPTMRMVELFYTENGLPIDMDKGWDYLNRYRLGRETNYDYKNIVALNTDVLNLHLRREPRFYADIAFDKGIWLRRDSYVQMDPYKDGANGIEEVILQPDSKVNITGYWVKKLVSRKNYSASNYYYFKPTAPFPKLRLADLYLIQAEAWNEYEGPSKKVYDALNVVRARAGIPTVQDSWNYFSKNPSKITNKAGMRDIIRQERMIEFAFEGHRFWDLRRWKIAHDYLTKPNKGWNIYGDNSQTFYNNFMGPVVVWKKNKFEAPRDYFWPIKDEEVLKANIVQNLGW